MKAERLLSALLLLQAHGRLPEREIAEHWKSRSAPHTETWKRCARLAFR